MKVGLEANAKRKAEILGSALPADMKAAQIASLDAETERLLEIAQGASKPATTSKAITTKAQYDALPRGATYVDPNGVTRTKG